MSLFSVETVAKLCRVWLNLMQRHPGIDELRANVKRIIPGTHLLHAHGLNIQASRR